MASAEAGQCVSLALKRVRRAAVRKGMVIAHKTEGPPPRGEHPLPGSASAPRSHAWKRCASSRDRSSFYSKHPFPACSARAHARARFSTLHHSHNTTLQTNYQVRLLSLSAPRARV